LFRYNFELVQQKEKAEKNISRNNNTVESDWLFHPSFEKQG
jgi:hypothetical protein